MSAPRRPSLPVAAEFHGGAARERVPASCEDGPAPGSVSLAKAPARRPDFCPRPTASPRSHPEASAAPPGQWELRGDRQEKEHSPDSASGARASGLALPAWLCVPNSPSLMWPCLLWHVLG